MLMLYLLDLTGCSITLNSTPKVLIRGLVLYLTHRPLPPYYKVHRTKTVTSWSVVEH